MLAHHEGPPFTRFKIFRQKKNSISEHIRKHIQDNYIRQNDMDFSPNMLLLDQVSEVTVKAANADASAGGGSSQVSYVTPSGGNDYHSSAY